MRKFPEILSLLLITGMLLAGCAIYNPKPTGIALITAKKELKVDAGVSAIPSAYANLSYGLTKALAIQAFGSLEPAHCYYFQGAGGFYKGYANHAVLEVYVGYGFGYGYVYKDAVPGSLYGNYQQYFTQVNFGFAHLSFAHMEVGAGLKSGVLHASLTNRNYYGFYSETGPFYTLSYNNWLLEPDFMIRLGGERLKVSLNAGFCRMNKIPPSARVVPFAPVNIALGLHYIFNP